MIRRTMTILFAASEMDPLARTGGLADVVEALPAALAKRGHEVSVVIPCYRGLAEPEGCGCRSTGVKIPVGVGGKKLEAEIMECTDRNGVQVFLIRHDEYFDRAGLYGEEGHDYEDNAERFIFFSRAVLELSRRILPPPEIVHVHDWQTALVPVLTKERRLPFQDGAHHPQPRLPGQLLGVRFRAHAPARAITSARRGSSTTAA